MNNSAGSNAHFTLLDRTRMNDLLQEGHTQKEIGTTICKSQSSISKELKRNRSRDGYDPPIAQRKADKRAKIPRTKPTLLTCPDIAKHLFNELRNHNSITQALKNVYRKYPSLPSLTPQSIYTWIKRSAHPLAKQIRKLLLHPRARRSKTLENKGGIKNMLPLSERPKEANDRLEPGHWESDLVEGKKGRSVVLHVTCRFTRQSYLIKCEDKTSLSITVALIGLFKRIPPHLRKTLTCDRGTEMAMHEILKKATGLQTYFCNPHSPWEKGQVENGNGNLRREFPKGTDFDTVSLLDLRRCEYRLNSRNMGVLLNKTPQELYYKAACNIPFEV